MKTAITRMIAPLVLATSVSAMTGCVNSLPEEIEEQSFNKIIVVIDPTGSFQKHLREAAEKVQVLVDKLSNERPATWMKRDAVRIISADARPDVLWAGETNQLRKQLAQGGMAALFEQRKPYRHCTDLVTALNLAITAITNEPRALASYLFIFSDLVHDPVRKNGGCSPAVQPPSPPPSGVNWAALDSRTAIMAFFVPNEQIAAWRAAFQAAPIPAKITFFNAAESRNTVLVRPDKPDLYGKGS